MQNIWYHKFLIKTIRKSYLFGYDNIALLDNEGIPKPVFKFSHLFQNTKSFYTPNDISHASMKV